MSFGHIFFICFRWGHFKRVFADVTEHLCSKADWPHYKDNTKFKTLFNLHYIGTPYQKFTVKIVVYILKTHSSVLTSTKILINVVCYFQKEPIVFFFFNATFNNISVISCRSVLLVEETGGPDKTTDLLHFTEKLWNSEKVFTMKIRRALM
jgi:hypothetical protein